MKNRSLPLPFLFFLFLSVFLPVPLLFPARTDAVPTERTEVLTLQQALELAFAAHPDLAGGAAALRSAAGSVEQERAEARPSLSASGSHTSREREDSQSASLKVQQLLSDGGKTAAAVRAAQRSEDAAASDLESLRNTLAYEVRTAYYELVRARQELQVALEMVALHEKHLDKAKALLAAGASPKSDVTAAEVDLSRSRLDLATARADAARAAAALENAMGLRSDGAAPEYAVEEPPLPDAQTLSLEEAVQKALAAHPDLRAKAFRVAEAEETLRLRRKGLVPSLSAYGGYSWSSGGTSDSEWEAGLALSVPLADGGLTAANITVAEAKLDAVRAEEERLRQTVLLEVRKAWLAIGEAEEKLETATVVVRQAKENLDLAEGRYQVGVGSSLEVSDAAASYSDARKSLVQARCDRLSAEAALLKVIGDPVVAAIGSASTALLQ
ncbi:TolC family protein [Aminiphilus sp.]|uniref:TolC family protein n=1 Tax=Aminiphilus sp. TaxID=1872488 RepID=UPI002626A669|nr:TolC family protein [Aminiphilus sp.]